MKKFKFLSTVLALSLFSQNIYAVSMLGDVDLDGSITANDAALVLNYVLNSDNVKLTDEQNQNAKVVSGGAITAENSAYILQKTLNNDFQFFKSILSKKPNGDGTEQNPYQITNKEELAYIFVENDKHYILMNDIDLSDIIWQPNGFAGKLDGQNHSITGITVSDYVEVSGFISTLFSKTVGTDTFPYGYYITSEVKNLNVEIKHSGKRAISSGGIAGICSAMSYIRYCSAKGKITAKEYAGGIVGEYHMFGRISNCNSEADVMVQYDDADATKNVGAGGIMGASFGGYNCAYIDILDCTATGNVSAFASKSENVYAGGIVGYAGCTMFKNCKANVVLKSNGTTGEIVGYGIDIRFKD